MDRSQGNVASTVASTVTTAAAGSLTERDPSSGTRLGDFTLLRQLGRGAQGEVYEARQESLGRLVALKVLPPYLTFNPDRVQRFKREAEAGGRLDHPNTVGVHSVGEHDGYHYIAQELVAGGRTLADEIAAGRAQPELPRDWYERMAQVFVHVAEAVHAAHEAGIIHRDLKPGNILLTRDGQPKVADFGLAMVLDDLHRSRSGELIGTPFYMSPEQAVGGRGLDRRTDVFSLGTTLYEALTLGRPFDGETRDQVVERILIHDPPDPRRIRPSVPRDLAVICMKALEKRSDRRYQSAGELASDVNRYLRHEPIVAKPPGLVMRAGKWLRRHPVPTAFAVVFAVMVVMLVAIYQSEQDAQTQRDYAQAKEADLKTLVDSLLNDVLFASRWDINEPRQPPSPTDPWLDRVVTLEQLAGAVEQLPEEQCHLLTAAGMAYASVSMFDRAEPLLVRALDLARRMVPADPEMAEAVARAALQLGLLRRWTGHPAEAEPLLEESRLLFVDRFGKASTEVLEPTKHLAVVLVQLGRMDEAEALLVSTIERWSGRETTQYEPLVASRLLGQLLMDAGRLDEAMDILSSTYEHSESVFPAIQHAELEAVLAQLYGRLSLRADKEGDAAESDRFDALALQHFTDGIARLREQRPDPTERTADALMNYGTYLSQRGRLALARPQLEEAHRMALLALGPDHRITLLALNSLGALAFREGDEATAEASWREILASDRRAPPHDTRAVLGALKNLSKLCGKHARWQEAVDFATELVERTPPWDPDATSRIAWLDELETAVAAAQKAASR